MLSDPELHMLRWLARDYFQGRGDIIDGGCFLGGSTAALADGLAGNPAVMEKRHRIHSYDTFLVDWYAKAEFFADSPLQIGDSFFDRWQDNVSRYGDLVVAHRGDIRHHPWPGTPVELLFLDVMKSVPIQSVVTERWFPCLLAKESILIQQDYVHEWQPWIIVSMELLCEFFVPLDYFDYGSAVFLCDRTPSPEAIAAADVAQLPLDAQLSAMDRAQRRVPTQYVPVLRLAKAKLLIDCARFDEARALVAEVRHLWPEDPRAARVGGTMLQHAAEEQARTSKDRGTDGSFSA